MAVIQLRDVHRMKRRAKHVGIEQTWQMLNDIGYMNDNRVKLSDFSGLKMLWKNQPAVVVGGGYSARGFDFDSIDGMHSIGVNHVIEIYDKFEVFLFQDLRFLRMTKYNMDDYKGIIVCPNTAPIDVNMENDRIYKYRPIYKGSLDMDANKGIAYRQLTGSAALHFALIAGADPIYLVGMDTPKDADIQGSHHIVDNYTGEEKTKKSFEGTLSKMKLFNNFLPYKDRIINVCENGRLPFKPICMQEFYNRIAE